MFLVNSRSGLVTAAPSSSGCCILHFTGAILLPKLRNHFAEFLNQSYLARLGILYLSTCVGLGYGRPVNSLEVFLGGMGVQRLLLEADRHHASGLFVARICLGHTLHVYPGNNQRPGPLTLPRRPIADLHRSTSTTSEDVVLTDRSWSGAHRAVREYQPVVHRLRLAASP